MIVEVVAGLAVREDRILLLKRHSSTVAEWSGAWCLAGGKVEPGESKEEALVREWGEELGGVIFVGDLLHARLYRVEGYPHPYRVWTFAVSTVTEPRLLEEGGQDLRWVPVAEMGEFRLLLGTVESVAAYECLYGLSGEEA